MARPELSTTHQVPAAVGGRSVATALPAVLAILLGLLVVGVAGFSPLEVIHNAAHDTRHSNGFPCH
jgi:cobalt transporter subunit CbtB